MKVYALFFQGQLLGLFKTKARLLKALEEWGDIVRAESEIRRMEVR